VIDFARYLSIWVIDLRLDERTFWKTMNPCRMHALLSARQRPVKRQAQNMPMNRAGSKPTQYIDFDEPITEQRNLAEYFMRG
jgi:hypothetical protein